ncbi:MAG: FAD-dependent oxidoreductase [Peptoniphilaceae bacterium]|nr:FAD-dependent oxidoreductase [Peptoniphilaceae bacterium]MDY6019732.1 FAD-dependent oxidoreductase [Anaerococcus sp.]
MSEDKFDAIIVGGGLAGISAALVMAKAGLEVMLIERGDYCGAKNMTGGRLYGHSLEKIIPNFAQEAPVERIVTKEKISIMSEDSSFDFTYNSKKLAGNKAEASYTVLRTEFDKWMAEKAEEAGANVITGILVEDLLKDENGKIIGVMATGEEIYSDVVILADGVNSLLSQQIGLKEELKADQVAVGAKEVIHIDEEVLNQRFGLMDNEGLSWLSVGDPTMGGFGGGLLYVNRDSVSIGVVSTLSDIDHAQMPIYEFLDRFKNHPSIAPYIEGGTTVEYSAHLVPEAGIHMLPKLYADGVLVTGDAAGFCINLGFTVRGMDFAIESGRLAAETVIRAKEREDFSQETLSYYKELLDDSFIMRDLEEFKGFPTLLSRREIFEVMPDLVTDIANNTFTVDGKPGKSMMMYAINAIAQRTSASNLVNFVTTVMEAF